MNLIFDFGNTIAKYAVFNGWELIDSGIVQPDFSIKSLHYSFSNSIICASGLIHQSIKDELELLKIPCKNFDQKINLPIKNLYKTPNTLGPDRLASAIGASIEFKNQHNLIIIAGTCITYNFVNAQNEYLGGAISPGMRMRYKSMNDYTAHLPYIENNIEINPLIGENTENCLRSGVVNGIVSEIEGFIHDYKLKYPNLNPILTGGDAEFLECQMKFKIFVSKFLVLKGLNAVLIHNEV